jgi:hypothetical protein
VSGNNATLTGLADANKLNIVTTPLQLMDRDKILTSGFIYSTNDVELTIDEYSRKIKVDGGTEYNFPTTFAPDGSFMLGTMNFFFVSKNNTSLLTLINMSENITDLEQETYYAYAFLTYEFQTSNPYPILGEQVIFEIEGCSLFPPTLTTTTAEFCVENTNLTIADLYPFIQGPTDNLRWYSAAGDILAITTPIVNDVTYYVTIVANGCISDPSPLTVKIIDQENIPAPAFDELFIVCDSDPVYLSDIPLPYDVSEVAWYDSETSTTPVDPATEILTDGASYWASQIIGTCESTGRTQVTIEFGTPDVPDGITSPQYFCSEATFYNINTYPYHPDDILWFESATATVPVADLETALVTGSYWAALKIGDCISGMVEIMIETDPAGADFEPVSDTFCLNATLADVTLSGTWGLVWFEDEAMTIPLPQTLELIDGVTYYAANTYDDCKVPLVALTVTLIQCECITPLPPTVTSPVVLCSVAGNLTLENVQVQGVNIQWYADEAATMPLPIDEPIVDGTIYWVSQSDDACESELSFVKVIIDNELVIPAPEITSPIELCQSLAGSIRLSELPIGNITVNWYYDAAGNYPAPANAFLVESGTYYATLVVGECEGTTLTPVEVQFVPAIHTVPVISSPQYFCLGARLSDIDAPNYVVWYATSLTTQPLPMNTILKTGVYYAAVAVGDCVSTQRVPITIGINPTDVDYVIEDQYFCDVATIADISVTGYGIVWYAEPELINVMDLNDPVVHGTTYYGANNAGSCAIINVAVTTYINVTVLPPTVLTPYELCGTEGNVTLAMIPVQGIGIQWYADEDGLYPIPVTTPVANGETYWVSQSLGACKSELSYVKAIINENMIVPPPAINSPLELCESLIDNLLLSELPVGDQNVKWYFDAEGNYPASPNTILVTNATFYASLIIGDCESTDLTQVDIVFLEEINTVPVINSPQYFCQGATFNNVIPSTHIAWFESASSTDPLLMNTILATGIYYAAVFIGADCESDQRVPVQIFIDAVNGSYATENQTFCFGATLADVSVLGYGVQWFDNDALTGEALPLNTILVDGETYYAANTNEDCAIMNVAVTVAVYEEILPPVLVSGAETNVCHGDDITTAYLESLIEPVPNIELAFYTDAACTVPFNGPITANYNVAPYTFYALAFISGTDCANDVEDALEIEITVTPIPETPVIAAGANTSVCDGELINETFLNGLLDYNASLVTIEYYLNAACTNPFTDITADYNDGSYTIYAIAKSLANPNCTSAIDDALELTITVNPRPDAPVIKNGAGLNICHGEVINQAFLLNLLNYNAAQVTIEFYMDAACTVPFTNITADYNDAPYTIYAIARSIATGCATDLEDALEIVIETFQPPFVDFVPELVYCDGEEVLEYAFTGSENTQFYWEFVVGSQVGLSDISGVDIIPPFTAVNSGTGQIQALYKVYAQNEHGCVSAPRYFYISVNPRPVTTPVEDMVYCNGVTAPAKYFASSVPGSTFEWEFTGVGVMIAGLNSGENFIPSFLAVNTGNVPLVGQYRVRASYEHTNKICEDEEWQIFDIVVLPTAPVPTVDPVTQEICSGETFDDIIFSSDNSNVVYKWTRTSGGAIPSLPMNGVGNITGVTINHLGITPLEINFFVRAELSYSAYPGYVCESQDTYFSITVNPNPTINTVEDRVFNHGDNVPPYYFTSNIPGATYKWEQTGGDDIGLPPSGQGNFPGFLASNPLPSTTPKVAYFKAWAEYGACEGVEVTFSITINPETGGTTEPPPPPCPNLYTQTVCDGETTQPVVFGCSGSDVTYYWTLTNPMPNFPPTGTGNFPSFTANLSGVTPVTAIYKVYAQIGSNPPSVDVNFSITVNPKPVLNPVVSPWVFYHGQSVPSYPFSSNVPNALYHWEHVGGDIIPTVPPIGGGPFPNFMAWNPPPSITPLVAFYEVWATFGDCISERVAFTIIINPEIIPNVPVVTPVTQKVCHGDQTQEIVFGGNTIVDVRYLWTLLNPMPGFPVSGEGNLPSFTAENTGIMTITANYKVYALYGPFQSDDAYFSIIVDPTPEINTVEDFVYCSGELAPAYTFSSNNSNAIYYWEYVGGHDIGLPQSGSGNFPSFVANNPTTTPLTANYKAWAKYGECTGAEVEFTITILPSLGLTINSQIAICGGASTLQIEYGVSIDNALYKLEFGNDALIAGFVNQAGVLPAMFIEVPIPQAVKPGGYAATLTVTFGNCETIYPILIVVNTLPIVSEMSDETYYYCIDDVIYLYAKVDGYAGYKWYFNGIEIPGATSYFYEDIYDATKQGTYTLDITNSCGTITLTFYVYPNPVKILRKWDDVLYVDNSDNLYVRYQWYKNGNPIPKDGYAQYYTEPGGFTPLAQYSVRAYLSDGTFHESCPIIANPDAAGIIPGFIVYPSPSQQDQQVTFLFTLPLGEDPDATIRLFDVTGKYVAEYKTTTHKTEVVISVAAGSYLVRANLKSGREFVTKIIIQK